MSKFNFVESEELIQSIIDKEIEEQDKLVEESEEDAPMNEYELRKLGWTGSFGWDWKIASTNILGQTITVTYSISLKSGKVKNTITFNQFESLTSSHLWSYGWYNLKGSETMS